MHPEVAAIFTSGGTHLQYPHAGRILCIFMRDKHGHRQRLSCSTLMRVESYASSALCVFVFFLVSCSTLMRVESYASHLQ